MGGGGGGDATSFLGGFFLVCSCFQNVPNYHGTVPSAVCNSLTGTVITT